MHSQSARPGMVPVGSNRRVTSVRLASEMAGLTFRLGLALRKGTMSHRSFVNLGPCLKVGAVVVASGGCSAPAADPLVPHSGGLGRLEVPSEK